MLKIALVILLAALSPFEVDRAQFEGVWIGTSDEDSDNNHSYIRINNSDSGRFVLVARGKTIYDFEFDSNDRSGPDGYVEISKSFGDTGVKIILSGWGSKVDKGAGLVTGIVYMYEAANGTPKVFNSMFLRMWAATGPVPSNDSDSSAVAKIYERYGDEMEAD
jgi:hypothetical protein